MNLFYSPELNEESPFCQLDKEESGHCIHSLRHKTGDIINVTNGRGLLAEGTLLGMDKGLCTVQITKKTVVPARNWKLEMAVAPTKNHDRFEWFVEKATEIGIDNIVPLICDTSIRSRIQHDRLNRLLIAAMKQSLNVHLPLLFPETYFTKFVPSAYTGQKFIAWCGDEEAPYLKDQLKKSSDVLILIGPEGDFNTEEMDLAKQHGFIPVSLGKNRLRTETAALTACIIANQIND